MGKCVFKGFAGRLLASAVCALAFMSGGAQAAPLLAFPSGISFFGDGGGSNGSVLIFTGSEWTGLDFFATSGNASVSPPPAEAGPTGSLSGSTGHATFDDTTFTTPGVLFTTSDSFVFSWSFISTNYTVNGIYIALFKGTIEKTGTFDPTPFELTFSTQTPAASSEVTGLSWSAQGAVISADVPLPATAALLCLGIVGLAAARRKRV